MNTQEQTQAGMIFPQVAILWWDESKTSRPTYFEGPSFHDLINGQLVHEIMGIAFEQRFLNGAQYLIALDQRIETTHNIQPPNTSLNNNHKPST